MMFLPILLSFLMEKLSTKCQAELGNLPQEQVQFYCFCSGQATADKSTLIGHQRYIGIQAIDNLAPNYTAFPSLPMPAKRQESVLQFLPT